MDFIRESHRQGQLVVVPCYIWFGESLVLEAEPCQLTKVLFKISKPTSYNWLCSHGNHSCDLSSPKLVVEAAGVATAVFWMSDSDDETDLLIIGGEVMVIGWYEFITIEEPRDFWCGITRNA